MRWNGPEVPLSPTNATRTIVRFAWLPVDVQGGTVWLERYRQHQWGGSQWWNGVWVDGKCREGCFSREVYR